MYRSEKCQHVECEECHCSCHTGGCHHIVPCCHWCEYCKKLIPNQYWDDVHRNKKIHRPAFDPILVSLVRRAMPNLIAGEICNVQPMPNSSELIFGLSQMSPEELREWDRKGRMLDIRKRFERNKSLMTQPKPDPAKVGLPHHLIRVLDIRKQVDCIEIIRDPNVVGYHPFCY